MSDNNYSGFDEYATSDHQKLVLEALKKTGTQEAAAEYLTEQGYDFDRGRVYNAWKSIRKKSTKQGYSPEHDLIHKIHEPQMLKGTSTLYDDKGNVKIQWVKTQNDLESFRDMAKEATESFYENLPPVKIPNIPKSRKFDTDIIPWIQIGDGHLGMLAHKWETGHNFDLEICERHLTEAISMLVAQQPACERVVLHDLGDMTHYENFDGVTQASGHALDYDGRFPKMIHVYSRLMRRMVDLCLTKFKEVDVIINQGNHSRTNDVWMAELLRVAYKERVNVLDNSNIFIPYRMGNTFVMTHHSDKVKPKGLADVMATDFHQDFGESFYRYIDIGHIHHNMVSKEHPAVQVESWNQLARADAYAHDHGYRSRSAIHIVQRSKTYGEVGRIRLPLEKVESKLADLPTFIPQRRKVFTV